MVNTRIRVVIVDDAEFMRKELTRILESDGDIEVVGYGKTGQEGIEAVKSLKPDVVTLDIDMPEMDGITALKHIMIECPTPVVVVSAPDPSGGCDVRESQARRGRFSAEAVRVGISKYRVPEGGADSPHKDRVHRRRGADQAGENSGDSGPPPRRIMPRGRRRGLSSSGRPWGARTISSGWCTVCRGISKHPYSSVRTSRR